MVRRQLAALVGAVLVPLLVAGCNAQKSAPGAPKAGAGASAAETNQQKSIDIRRREENMIAACMKKSGFTYVPHVPDDMLNPPAPKPGDYASIKAFRSKYGFGELFAPFVYPGDPNITPPKDDDPNEAITDRMDPAQYKAYRVALDDDYNDKNGPFKMIGGCKAEAAQALDPINYLRAKIRIASLSNKNAYDQNSPEFKQTCAANPECANYNADEARLKPLRDAYAACLKSKGYTVQPDNAEIEESAKGPVIELMDKYDKDPDPFKTVFDPADARKGLASEVKIALEDLDCGKDYFVTQAQIDAKNRAQSPPSGRLL